MNDANWTPIILALIAIFGQILMGVGGFFVYRRLNKANVVSQEFKNDKTALENYEFGNDVLNRIGSKINPILVENNDLRVENHNLKSDLEISKLKVSRAQGGEESAIRQRNEILEDVEKLKDEVHDLTEKVRILEGVVHDQGELLRLNGIEFTPRTIATKGESK